MKNAQPLAKTPNIMERANKVQLGFSGMRPIMAGKGFLSVKCFVNFGFGDGAFANDAPLAAVDANDSGGEGGAGVAAVEDEWEAVAELLDDLAAIRARGKAREVRAGSGDGSADGFDQRCDDARVGPAESDAAAVAGNFEWHAVSRRDDERQRARPEFVREGEKCVGHLAGEGDRLLNRTDENRQSFRLGAALDAKDLLDGGEIEGVGRKGVERVCRHGYDTAALDEAGG
jgi:hypothetical protein